MTDRSRLSRRTERQTKKNLVLSILGIIILLFLLFKFGLPLLINFSLFIAGTKESLSNSQEKKDERIFVSPPILNQPYSATNSAVIDVSGIAGSKQVIRLYVNDELADKETAKDDGTFVFQNIHLTKGSNILKAKASIEDNGSTKKESDFSDIYSLGYLDKQPTLSIDSPNDGQNFGKEDKNIKVTGKTDPGIRVTVNDFIAIVDSDGKFAYNLTLQNGENKIKIVATDDAGNKIESERKVTFSP